MTRHLFAAGILSSALIIAGCNGGSTPASAPAGATADKPEGKPDAPSFAANAASASAPGATADKTVGEPNAPIALAAPNAPGEPAAPTSATDAASASAAAGATADKTVGKPDAPAEVLSPEAARKKAQIEWALKDEEIKSDPKGQWAAKANGSSAYNDAKGTAAYAASQATGPANVQSYGNNGSAWTPKTADTGIEWLELQFAKPVHATAVRVRESYGSGAVIKVELFDEQNGSHTVWTGTDPTKELNYFVVEFPKTAFKTGKVKLTLATNVVGGWNEIDAVQLVGTAE